MLNAVRRYEFQESCDFSVRVMHYVFQNRKNTRILRYGEKSFLGIIKSLKGGHRNLLKL